jgi:hypothetical protein
MEFSIEYLSRMQEALGSIPSTGREQEALLS